ncbi:phosphatidylinositol 4-phosphate 5-kinase 1-like [Iris pallida]|uniref:Phosphatidylinositol 4-phosphate 5-kinase 1-like n=1 Tax=Iris pallida TaxID=29817 RepID=A0AAX6G5L7_IRIPA|nr:phosphatidylinositol 4-phosphate 5-kinase 1-like [Iris pallida]
MFSSAQPPLELLFHSFYLERLGVGHEAWILCEVQPNFSLLAARREVNISRNTLFCSWSDKLVIISSFIRPKMSAYKNS